MNDDRITLDIDTTMMEPTEVRIIESHLRAIQAVVDGAKPQGSVDPEPVPEWGRLVDQASVHVAAEVTPPLSSVLFEATGGRTRRSSLVLATDIAPSIPIAFHPAVALIADVLAWVGGYRCMCDDALIGAEKRDDIYAAARECAADLERECEDR